MYQIRPGHYTVYFRDGRYQVCHSSFNNLLFPNEICATDLSYSRASHLAGELMWKYITEKYN